LNQHPDRIPGVITKLVRRIYEINFLVLHRILGLALDIVNQHPTSKPSPSEDLYFIPDPSEEIPDQVSLFISEPESNI